MMLFLPPVQREGVEESCITPITNLPYFQLNGWNRPFVHEDRQTDSVI